MRHDDLDRILAAKAKEEILPSSGFVASVMDAVRHDAGAPPPIPFPWKRALPGLCAAGLALVWVLIAGGALFIGGTATQPLPARLPSTLALIVEAWKIAGASWIALALALSFASVKLSMRFVLGKT
jgi:hypothetical protein